jgi:hypothetical protein
MPMMAAFNGLDSPNSRKRKQELQYQMDNNDQHLFDYYQQEQQQQQQFYPSSSSSSNMLDFHQQDSFYYNQRYYDDRSNTNSAFQKPLLHLDDLSQKNQQKELIQAWSMSGNTTQSNTNTPGFFSPSFLDSLQQDKSLDFPFHTPSNEHQHDFMMNQPIMVKVKITCFNIYEF